MTVLLSDGKNNLKDALHQILDTFTADIDFSRGVFIKPNIVFAVKPKSGEITSPVLVKTLIAALRERHPNLDILLGEGVAAGCNPEENFRVSGFSRLAQELHVPLIDLNVTEHKKVSWKFGELELPCVALERVYINLPILKPSSACVISGALKNQKGLALPGMKKHFHRLGLQEQIAELNVLIKPALTIMDGRHFFRDNLLISGDNCGEIDATACQLLGIEEPDHVRLARSAGVFTTGYAVRGEKARVRQSAVRPIIKEYKRLGRLRLWSNPQACTMCRYLFHNVQKQVWKPKNFRLGVKLLFHSIKGAELIMGSNAHWRKDYSTVICIGACTRRIAKEGDYIYIPGCPPTVDDFNKYLQNPKSTKENNNTPG